MGLITALPVSFLIVRRGCNLDEVVYLSHEVLRTGSALDFGDLGITQWVMFGRGASCKRGIRLLHGYLTHTNGKWFYAVFLL